MLDTVLTFCILHLEALLELTTHLPWSGMELWSSIVTVASADMVGLGQCSSLHFTMGPVELDSIYSYLFSMLKVTLTNYYKPIHHLKTRKSKASPARTEDSLIAY